MGLGCRGRSNKWDQRALGLKTPLIFDSGDTLNVAAMTLSDAHYCCHFCLDSTPAIGQQDRQETACKAVIYNLSYLVGIMGRK